MFENVMSNLLKKPAFHVQKPMNTVSFVDVEKLTKFYLTITVTTNNGVSVSESYWDLIEGD